MRAASSINERGAFMSQTIGRAIIIVLDSVGCGGAEDAAAYGDVGADTLGHIALACADGRGDRAGLRTGPLHLPHLDRLGLGHTIEASTGRAAPGLALGEPAGQWGYGVETSRGKDTPSGHWEIAGTPVDCVRHDHHRGFRRGTSAHPQADLLHVGRFGAADRRP
jgi:phosphopentomutase